MPTQLERSALTREKALAATVECLAESGYRGTTITAVAERAGISRGALSHQYPDKQGLVVNAIQEIGRRHTERLHELIESLPRGRRRVEVCLDGLWAVFREPIYSAALEVYVGARTDPLLQPHIVALETGLDDMLREFVRAAIGPSDAPLLDERADVLINTLRGLALLHATGMPIEHLERTWARARADTLNQLLA
jgi:AcrR family transcriptional regulator